MKKLFALLLCAALCFCTFAPIATSALINGGTLVIGDNPAPVTGPRKIVNEETYAFVLRELGLFRGVSETNFDLERAPTRLETLVMLIRVLGKEADALAQKLPHPFTDVPAWGNDYVGYAYANGLTKGSSATTFGMSDATAVTYLTFMLRALGYSDADGDFAWDKPETLAKTVGILPDEVNTTEFWRADIVTISLYALEAKLKGADTTLAEKLIGAGVFDKATFDRYMNRDKVEVSVSYTVVDDAMDIASYVAVLQVTDKAHTYKVLNENFYTITMTEMERQVSLKGFTGEALTEALRLAYTEITPELADIFRKAEVSADWKTVTLTVDKAAYLATTLAQTSMPLTAAILLETAQSFALVPIAERTATVLIVSEAGDLIAQTNR